MLILRTYALYERDNRVLGLMAVFSACVIGACLWGTIFSGRAAGIWPGANLPINIGCTYTVTHAQTTGLIIAWASMGWFDAFIFFLTLYRALSQRHLTEAHLLSVLLRDGTISDWLTGHLSSCGWFSRAILSIYHPLCGEMKC